MAAPTQNREGSTAARCVLTILLLALAVLLGTTVPESAAPSAATAAAAPTTAGTPNETVTAGASVASIGDPTASVEGSSTSGERVAPTVTIATAGHLDEPAGLLCVCALLVTGLAMLRHGIAMLWRRRTPILGRESSTPTSGTGMRAAMQQASPLTWGVCRR